MDLQSWGRVPVFHYPLHHVPPGRPNEWSLANEIIGLPHLKGGHSGNNQADVLIQVVDHYDFAPKVSMCMMTL